MLANLAYGLVSAVAFYPFLCRCTGDGNDVLLNSITAPAVWELITTTLMRPITLPIHITLGNPVIIIMNHP